MSLGTTFTFNVILVFRKYMIERITVFVNLWPWAKYSTDNVFVVILFVYRTYTDGIFIAYRWYVNGNVRSVE